MSDKPIMFTDSMLRALLDGNKTQWRQRLPVQPFGGGDFYRPFVQDPRNWQFASSRQGLITCYWKALICEGDRLWVKEGFRRAYNEFRLPHIKYDDRIFYRADRAKALGMDEYSDRHNWSGKVLMPKEYSRLTLIITDVRVQRLQDISDADAIAEGVPADYAEHIHGPGGFRDIWGSTNGKKSWDKNPWVVAYTFTVERGNIDQVAK